MDDKTEKISKRLHDIAMVSIFLCGLGIVELILAFILKEISLFTVSVFMILIGIVYYLMSTEIKVK